MSDIEKLTDELLAFPSPVSILECRSGWRVFVQTGLEDNEAIGKNVAYSYKCSGFENMLKKAIEELKKRL